MSGPAAAPARASAGNASHVGEPPAPALALALPGPADADELLAFELANRAFFEACINARPASFYSAAGVRAAIDAAQHEAAEDRGYGWLVRDAGGTLVGRVNLTRVRRAHFHSAELGYRVAEAAGGRGVASEAVRQAVAHAFGALGLRRLEATARPENIGSLRVLARNGFHEFGRSRRSFELGGRWYDRVHFERHAEPGGPADSALA